MSGVKDSAPAAIKELARLNQWVGYSRAKIPIQQSGKRASSTDPSTWGTLADAKMAASLHGLPGVGFVFQEGDPYVGVDLDAAIDSSGNLKPWAADIVRELDSYTELSPSGNGVHIWIKGNIPRAGARLNDAEGRKVEIYKSGRYFTVTGLHLEGTPTEIKARPEVLGQFFARNFEHNRERVTTDIPDFESPDAVEWIDDALAVLNPDMEEWEWRKVGAALKSELGDAGFQYWDNWSANGDKYPGSRDLWKRWQSIDESAWSIASLVWLAEQNGFTPPPARLVVGDQVSGWDDWMRANTMDVKRPDQPLMFHDFVDLYTDDTPFEPNMVEPGVLGEGDLMLIFGPPKSYKSMAALAMCRNWALGRPFLGMEPARPLKTIMLQFELKRDNVRRRLHLTPLTSEELAELRGKLWITGRSSPVLNADFVLEFAKVALEQVGPDVDLLVIDPMANLFPGDNENDNSQMQRFIRALKVLRDEVNPHAAIVLVHHSRKSSREERHSEAFNAVRGAGSLRGSYDAGMSMDPMDDESGSVKVKWELRNGPPFSSRTVRFENGDFAEVQEATSTLPGSKRDRIVEQVLLDAEHGVVHAVSSFCNLYHEDYGDDVRKFGSMVRDMIKAGQLCVWERPDVPTKTANQKGWLGVPGMLFRGSNI